MITRISYDMNTSNAILSVEYQTMERAMGENKEQQDPLLSLASL